MFFSYSFFSGYYKKCVYKFFSCHLKKLIHMCSGPKTDRTLKSDGLPQRRCCDTSKSNSYYRTDKNILFTLCTCSVYVRHNKLFESICRIEINQIKFKINYKREFPTYCRNNFHQTATTQNS